MASKRKPVTIATNTGALSEAAVPKLEEAPVKEEKQKTIAKHPGGRPKKTTPKAENRTISMDPILFEKYLIISERTNKVSISEFLRHAVEFYCQQNSISLYDDELNNEAAANYKARLEEKENKKKK